MKKRIPYWPHLLTVMLLICAGCTDHSAIGAGDQKDVSPAVMEGNQLMRFFAGNHPDVAIIKYAQADLDNDGHDDMVVIYRATPTTNLMCIVRHVRHDGPALTETNPVPAPVADQMIQFRNIDDTPPLEFILQGRKGAKVGYAIFRVENGRLVDLFGDGMEDCC